MPGMTMTNRVSGAVGTGAAGGGNTVRIQDVAAGCRPIGLAIVIACWFMLAAAAEADDPVALADPPVGQSLADDACLQEVRRCCGCPGWTHYVVFDLLFLQRNNQAG
ncbi:MAG: hypothetical protein ACKO6B_07635, partial [Planctomycetia bacterium]